jgi:hypothetical protein
VNQLIPFLGSSRVKVERKKIPKSDQMNLLFSLTKHTFSKIKETHKPHKTLTTAKNGGDKKKKDLTSLN